MNKFDLLKPGSIFYTDTNLLCKVKKIAPTGVVIANVLNGSGNVELIKGKGNTVRVCRRTPPLICEFVGILYVLPELNCVDYNDQIEQIKNLLNQEQNSGN